MQGKLRQAFQPLLSLSVRKKFLIASKLSCLLTLLVFSVLYVIQEKASFLEKKTEQLQSISKIIASNSEAALIFDDPHTVKSYLLSLENAKDITQAVLFDRNGEFFAEYQSGRGSIPREAPQTDGIIPGEKVISFIQPIFMRDELLGTLVIEADTSSLRQILNTAIIKASSAVAVGIIFSLFVAILIQRLITRPLSELEELAKTVAQDGDYSRRANKRYDDEVGSLAESVNIMMECVQERDEAINTHNRTLEEQVSRRTAELRTAMEQAKAASQAKSEFLSTMSHELRTPLNAIVGMSGIVASEELTPELASHVKIIQSSSDTLLSIINQILDYSKIESGHLELESREFDLANCIEETMDMVSSVHWEKPVDFFTTIDPELPYMIKGDVTRLRQVMVNLLGNAAKFTNKGHVWIEAKLHESPKGPKKDHIRISIHDTGIGIPADRIDKLFKTFSQVDSSTTREFGGTGLGLAITKKLVLAMGGEITVTSKEGAGSTFTIDLPVEHVGKKTVAEALRPTDLEPNTTLSLLIPFEPLHRSLSSLLEKWGLSLVSPSEPSRLAINSYFYNYTSSSSSSSKSSSAEAALALVHPQKQERAKNGMRSIGPLNLKDLRNFVSNADGKPNVVKTNVASNADLAKLPDKDIRILLAEDNKVNQKVFQLLMKKAGYSIDIVNNGREAVAALHKTAYQIVFMDLQMPVMDGLEACESIRANTELVQPWIVGFTANVESDAAPTMREAGMDDYISKPAKSERIQEALTSYQKAKEAFKA